MLLLKKVENYSSNVLKILQGITEKILLETHNLK